MTLLAYLARRARAHMRLAPSAAASRRAPARLAVQQAVRQASTLTHRMHTSRPALAAGSALNMSRKSRREMSTQPQLFDKILIANRGEIACRVIKSCRALGIKTVAIYSEPDAASKHVTLADEAYCVGPAQSAESYLNIPRILEVINESGAQAVHPGYGFLSENSGFQEALKENGTKFIGPDTFAITVMGDKIQSKKLASDAKVNTIPGFLGETADAAAAVEEARKIGYPVMVKASAGGGGKGMRVAWNDAEVETGFRLSRAEAASSFADDTIFIEKFIEEPRHIEIQVLADQHGNAIYLNERECSVQRRNQKVVEEAPSVFLDDETRKAMGEQAVALCHATNYESAGTVEFLVDKNKDFYFLEMNTRLQVEHPVTEYITGVDLVEEMIRVAAGQELTYKQEDIGIKGWAIESRVYAEDPQRDFLPSIGRLSRYVEPTSEDGDVRVDSGVTQGSEISMFYDPMICKLITYADTRDEALDKMRDALDSYVIRGVQHNIGLLRSVIDNQRFIDGRLTTGFIAEEYPDGYKGHVLTAQDRETLAAAAVMVHSGTIENQLSINGQNRLFERDELRYKRLGALNVTFGGDRESTPVQVALEGVAEDEEHPEYQTFVLSLRDGADGEVKTVQVGTDYVHGDFVFTVDVNGESHKLQVVSAADDGPYYTVQYMGTQFKVELRTPREAELLTLMPEPQVLDTAKFCIAPMPGAVQSIVVKEGDKVIAGQPLVVLEAMKMQNELQAEKDGVVKKVYVTEGASVSSEDILVEFEDVSEEE